MAKINLIRLKLIDSILRNPAGIQGVKAPQEGWLYTVRKALGLSLTSVAARIGRNPQNIIKFERNEAAGTLSLANLQKIAEAMNCEVVYMLVPKADHARSFVELTGAVGGGNSPATLASSSSVAEKSGSKASETSSTPKNQLPPLEKWQDLLASLAQQYGLVKLEIPGPDAKPEIIPGYAAIQLMVTFRDNSLPPLNLRLKLQKAVSKVLGYAVDLEPRRLAEETKPDDYFRCFLQNPYTIATW